ncbi:LOW QUALITY PROTEIN: uncharacterized protein LOC121084782 [Falco naumanni]|uniref:LOW QUALITY PROTEIN: uncharacterized protein LOC121084782 n=1 Tax=Falco naumanni TaxID=148594 RepID=UPI001ADE8E28|nr:LOW QUALITY PROTEIN: uncharacterized protein LOC121084782 [Falco naumanni]
MALPWALLLLGEVLAQDAAAQGCLLPPAGESQPFALPCQWKHPWWDKALLGCLGGGLTPALAGYNAALGRPARQSSIFPNISIATNAVDGNRDGVWHHGSCSRTRREREPWWSVDLGGRRAVAAVVVKNRQDCCWQRLRGAQVHVGDAPAERGRDNPICGVITDAGPGSLSTICCQGLQGRYVSILIPSREDALVLCEVEVVLQGCLPLPGGEGLPGRQWGPVGQQSGAGSLVPCSHRQFQPPTWHRAVPSHTNAVDGSSNANWEHGSCTHTEKELEPWWRVDLGHRHTVYSVTVTNRHNCCWESLLGAQVHVGDSLANHGKRNPVLWRFPPSSCGAILDTGPGSTSTICCNGLPGRYVSIIIPGREDFLILCEVEVTAQSCVPPPGGKDCPKPGPAAPSGTVLHGQPSQQCHQRRRWEPGWELAARLLLSNQEGVGAMVDSGPGPSPCCGSCGGEEPPGLLLALAEGCPRPCRGLPCQPWHQQPHVSATVLTLWCTAALVLGHPHPCPPPCSCGTVTDTSPGSTSTICCHGLHGRYVTITIPGREERLSLCEVEVVEQGCAVLPGGEWVWGAPRGLLGTWHPQPSCSRSPERGPGPPGHPVLHPGCQQQCRQCRQRGLGWQSGARLCAHTTEELEPWWRVDLGHRHAIYAVVVKNRHDCCWERLKGAEVRVGDSPVDRSRHNPVCGIITDASPGSISTVCCHGLRGRYVSILIPGRKDALVLCEVEVIRQGCTPLPGGELSGEPTSPRNPGTHQPTVVFTALNVAREQQATQSSTSNGSGFASKAVDGNRDGVWHHGSCSHTRREREPWWSVDLGRRHAVAAVVVKNRQDCCWQRLRGAQVHVGDAPADRGRDNPICGIITDAGPGSLSTICCQGLQGRYVTVTIPGREGQLVLCEVEVYTVFPEI